jgi:glutathione S-transferase
LRRHPWGKIPVITTGDGFTLYESRAICKFLAAKYNFPLLPPLSDLVARAVFDQAESAEVSYFSPSAGAISFEKFAKPLMGLTTDQAVVARERKKLQEYFDIINEILARQGYLAGNDYSLVDIYHIPVVERLFACGDGDLIRERANVNAWWQRCLSRPAVKKYMDEMPSFEDIKKKLAASKN